MSIVIPRSVWRPRYDNGVSVIGTGEWLAAGKELWLHHSTTNPPGVNATLEEDCAHMREFEQIGENRFGSGISYTWVVMPSGRVFEGHSIDRQGTHTYQRNNRSRAICLAGNYENYALPNNMINSVAILLRELGATIDGGHRDVYATACPGRFSYPRIGEINSLATSGLPITGDDDMQFSDKFTTYGGEEITVLDFFKRTDSAVKDLYDKFNKPQLRSGGDTYDISGFDLLRYVDNNGIKLDQVLTAVGDGTPAEVDYDVLADKLAERGVKADVDYARIARDVVAELKKEGN